MRDLFSQCMCACTCRSRSRMSICTPLHSHARNSCVTCTNDGGACGRDMRSRLEDGKERRFLTIEDGKDSAAAPPQRICFVELSAERSQWLATLSKIKQQSQRTKEAKSKRAKKNKRNWKHIVESLHKPGINHARFHVRFDRSPLD